jgi:predicted nucleic acid-binding protein
VTTAVLDAAVVIKWLRADGERHVEAARALRTAYEAGELIVFAPPLLRLEIINVAGRRWRWDETALLELAASLDDLGFELTDPDLARVAYWTARGLTAYDASYVAVAEA